MALFSLTTLGFRSGLERCISSRNAMGWFLEKALNKDIRWHELTGGEKAPSLFYMVCFLLISAII